VTFSPDWTMRAISMISRMRVIGCLKGMPWKPSITCGPLVPRPRMKRPPVSADIVAAVMPISAGVRVPAWRMPVPSLIFEVRAAT